MPRIIALSQPDARLAAHLRERGYQVIDVAETCRQRIRVDAIMYSARHPGGISASNQTEADLSVGCACFNSGDPFDIPALNITGLDPAQAADLLETRLTRRSWHS